MQKVNAVYRAMNDMFTILVYDDYANLYIGKQKVLIYSHGGYKDDGYEKELFRSVYFNQPKDIASKVVTQWFDEIRERQSAFQLKDLDVIKIDAGNAGIRLCTLGEVQAEMLSYARE